MLYFLVDLHLEKEKLKKCIKCGLRPNLQNISQKVRDGDNWLTVRNMMEKCWHRYAENRPEFKGKLDSNTIFVQLFIMYIVVMIHTPENYVYEIDLCQGSSFTF